MTNPTNSIKRTSSAQKAGAGIKALIMAASLATMIGGWGILAVGQTKDAIAAAQQPQAFAQSASSAPSTTLRQVTAPITQPRAVARTRSSR